MSLLEPIDFLVARNPVRKNLQAIITMTTTKNKNIVNMKTLGKVHKIKIENNKDKNKENKRKIITIKRTIQMMKSLVITQNKRHTLKSLSKNLKMI